MPKKSGAEKANKSHGEHSQKQGHAQKLDRGEGSSKSAGHQEKNNQRELGGGMGKALKGLGESNGGQDNAFDNIGKLAGGTKSKSGCLPKLFMLLLPFTAAGAYFFLKL